MASLSLKRRNPFDRLRERNRYKIFFGGRGGAKSWNFARALVLFSNSWKLRILCAREFQSSIADSVHRLIADQIELLGLGDRFLVTEKSVVNRFNGSEFIFKGLKHSIREIKSLEGIDICWVEEAQSVSKKSWEILIPTIRKDLGGGGDSEIWISFNPEYESDATYQMFVLDAPEGAIVEKVGWEDNPFFPPTLERERRSLLARDLEAYDHIWGGNPKSISDAIIFRKRVKIERYVTPMDARYFHGLDFGFANDPTAFVRSWIREREDFGSDLMIDREQFGYGVEIDEYPQLLDAIETARGWPIKADNSRPESISYIARQGYNIEAATKWPGSVEDGIAYLKSFRNIIIHEACTHMRDEARLYSYKVDPKTSEVLPIVLDKHNHGWDAERYGLDGYITSQGRGIVINNDLLDEVARSL